MEEDIPNFSLEMDVLARKNTSSDDTRKREWRFATLTEQQMQQILADKHSEKTKQSTNWSVGTLKAWCTAKKIQTPVEKMSIGQLDANLRRFYAEARSKSGETYSKSTLLGFRHAIERFLNAPPLNKGLKLSSDPRFKRSNEMLNAQIVPEDKCCCCLDEAIFQLCWRCNARWCGGQFTKLCEFYTTPRVHCEDLAKDGDVAICYTQFINIMKTDFPEVRIPKVNRLTKCDVCTVLKEEKEKTMDKNVRNYLDELYKLHNDLQMEERKACYYHRKKVSDLANHTKYLCLIIDGMDQSKLLVPNLRRWAKSYASAWRLQTHLNGVINHGREVLGLFDLFQWPHDSNLTMNVLLRVLERCDYVPDVIYLQRDNCFWENKNQFVFVFLGILVKLDIFRKVKINFLMVGHTHEIIDQVFSRLGVEISKSNLLTFDDLMDALRKAYTPAPHVELMENMFDIRRWIQPVAIPLHNITNPHCFVIQKAGSGDVVLRYKNWSRDKEWLPSKDLMQCIKILKGNGVPDGIPLLIPPSSDKLDLQRLESDIPKFLKNSRAFSEEAKAWWGRFFETRNQFYTPKEQPTKWPLDELLAIKRRQQAAVQTNDFAGDENSANPVASVPRPPSVPDSVVELVSGQFSGVPEVYTGLYVHPRRQVTIPRQVDDHLAALKEGVFVAIALEGYGKILVLGKVSNVKADTFELIYWKGSWRTAWSPWMRGAIPWTDELPHAFY